MSYKSIYFYKFIKFISQPSLILVGLPIFIINCTNSQTAKIQYPLPDHATYSYKIDQFIHKVKKENIKDYIIYDHNNRNSFGPSPASNATIVWINPDSTCLKRIIKRNNNSNTFTDSTFILSNCTIFDFMKTSKIGSTKSLPEPGLIMFPKSYIKLQAKSGEMEYKNEIEWLPFVTSQDSNHVLIKFVNKITDSNID